MIEDEWKTEIYSIECPRTDEGDYNLLAIRQLVRIYENGDAHKIASHDVKRNLSAIAADAIPGGPFVIETVADLIPVFKAMADHYHAEDIDAQTPPPDPEV